MINITKNRRNLIIAIIGTVILISVSSICLYSRDLINTIKNYNQSVDKFNALATEYNSIAEQSCVDNVEGLAPEMGLLKREDETFFAAIKVMMGSNSKEKIKKDALTILSMIEKLEECNQIVQEITNPTEEWVVDKLERVAVVKEIQTVTEKNNPDGLLDEVGGYKACVYFSIAGLDVSEIPGKSVVEKGTDGGGAVEIYASLKEAEERCAYLQGFDNTILYSGSYAIVGTMVVRTSYLLSEEDQLHLTNEIVKQFTNLEESKKQEERISVQRIEAFQISSSLVTIKKDVADVSEINLVCDFIKSINYEEYDWSLTPSLIGPATTLFKLYLSNGTIHQVKFLTYGSNGEQITIDDISYRYEGDFEKVADIWNRLSDEGKTVDVKEVQQ